MDAVDRLLIVYKIGLVELRMISVSYLWTLAVHLQSGLSLKNISSRYDN